MPSHVPERINSMGAFTSFCAIVHSMRETSSMVRRFRLSDGISSVPMPERSIRKDKVFVFGDYEGIRQSKGVTTVDTVPSPRRAVERFARHLILCQLAPRHP